MTGSRATVGALLGAGAGLGLWLIVRGWTGVDVSARSWRPRPVRYPLNRRGVLRLVGCVGVAALVGAASGWVVGAVLAATATWWLPRLLGPDRDGARRIARFEAVAAWAEMLRDTLAAAAGLEQAILVTAPLVPDAIGGPLSTAADRLRGGERLPDVLHGLAEDLADPTADLVISALMLAAEQRARDLGSLLGSLARSARDHAALRMSVAAGRAQVRSEVRITVGVTLVFALGLLLLDRRYLAAYSGPSGQLVLLVVGALFAAGFALAARIARIREPHRLLAPHTKQWAPDKAARAAAGS